MIKEFSICLIVVICLAGAGSDDDYFPWVNIAGTTILVTMGMLHHMKKRNRNISDELEIIRRINSRLGNILQEEPHSLRSRGASFRN